MWPKLAALLPSLTIGMVSVRELLSRASLAASGPLDARLARELPSRLAAFLHADANLYGSVMAQVLHLAFLPAHAALSLLAALYQATYATAVAFVHAAPLYLSHWM